MNPRGLTTEERRLMRDVLLYCFPHLADEDQPVVGADVVQDLGELYRTLSEAPLAPNQV